jgi:hypothetical protein
MLEETILYQRLRAIANGPGDDFVWLKTFNYEFKKEIIFLIQNDQLTDKGIDEAGQIIGYYSYVTELITRGRKQQGEPYNLNDTGAFYRSMIVNVFRDSFVIDADADKGQDNLFEKYGDGIIGLTDENLQKVALKIGEKYRFEMEQLLYGIG